MQFIDPNELRFGARFPTRIRRSTFALRQVRKQTGPRTLPQQVSDGAGRCISRFGPTLQQPSIRSNDESFGLVDDAVSIGHKARRFAGAPRDACGLTPAVQVGLKLRVLSRSQKHTVGRTAFLAKGLHHARVNGNARNDFFFVEQLDQSENVITIAAVDVNPDGGPDGHHLSAQHAVRGL